MLNDKEPTGRDYVTALLLTIIGTVSVGYLALWRYGLL